MADTTIGTIEELLESAIDEAEDPDTRFKLRSALQLLVVVENRHVAAREALEDANLEDATLEDDVREKLEDLGYL